MIDNLRSANGGLPAPGLKPPLLIDSFYDLIRARQSGCHFKNYWHNCTAVRIARKATDPWNGINWRWEIPADANPLDIVEAKARIVADRMPEKYQQTLQMLADGCSPNLINQFVSIGEDTIRWIRKMHPQSIARVKESILDNLMEAGQVLSERLAREAKDLPPSRLANALAATIDKAQLLSGGVTQRTETRKVVTREELQQLFEALPRAKAKVIEDQKDAD